MADVLSAASSGESKTYIMRRCNLSYRQLQAYLGLLVDKGLLKKEPREGNWNPAKIFVTTEKGQAFLRAYSDLRATIREHSVRLNQ